TTTIWTQRESLHHETFVEKINPLDPDAQLAFQQMRELGLSDEQTSAYLAKTITEQGLIISANEIFWLAAGIFILMLVVVWFAKPPFSPGK
ncbi:MFS transporter, partial [Escherichia coli]